MTDHDAQLDAMTQQLVTAGLIETFTDADDDEAMRLTPEGEKVARQLAMSDDDSQDDLMEALLARAAPKGTRAFL
jgi:DNA-binding MarR family transcriptional regulator